MPAIQALTGITAGFEPAGGGYAEYVRVMSFVLPGVVKIPRAKYLHGRRHARTRQHRAQRRQPLNLLPGDTVLVAGQGPIGLMFTRLLDVAGMKVVATDLMESRLKLARKWGATLDLQFGSPPTGRMRRTLAQSCSLVLVGVPHSPPFHDSNFDAAIDRLTHGRSLDAAVIAVPADSAVSEARASLVRGAGQILLFCPHPTRGRKSASAMRPDLASICVDEKDLIGSYSSDYTLQKEVARLVFSRKLDVRQIITHQFPLEQTAAAVELAATPNSRLIENHGDARCVNEGMEWRSIGVMRAIPARSFLHYHHPPPLIRHDKPGRHDTGL